MLVNIRLNVARQIDIWSSWFNVGSLTPLILVSLLHLVLLSTGIRATAFFLHLSLLFHFLFVVHEDLVQIPDFYIIDLFLNTCMDVITLFVFFNKQDRLVRLFLSYGILTRVSLFHVKTLIGPDRYAGFPSERKTFRPTIRDCCCGMCLWNDQLFSP